MGRSMARTSGIVQGVWPTYILLRLELPYRDLSECDLKYRYVHASEKLQCRIDNICMGCLADTRDIANACLFLLSDPASFILGQIWLWTTVLSCEKARITPIGGVSMILHLDQQPEDRPICGALRRDP